ncbi:hypothetical protein [Acholeplasma laidlawii]|uniref:hypothetical protein n=1 Tax=Acholeplasma laidlawii TaxID=2148 RepID=UPI0021F7D0E1|nr:hypothetical protein [Acholeplasma laidlawii]
MINNRLYKEYIINLASNTGLKRYFRPFVPTTIGPAFIDELKKVGLNKITGYSSKYTCYDLLFGNMNTVNGIHTEYENHLSNGYLPTIPGGLYNQFNTIYNQDKSLPYLIEAIGVKVCPYCHTQLIYKFKKGTKRRVTAQIDHMISRSDNPFLSMSCGNFIPSCFTCNSQLKGAKSFKIMTYSEINNKDYYDLAISKNQRINFYTHSKIDAQKMEIRLSARGISHNHTKVLEIENRVNAFINYLADYINLQRNTTKNIARTMSGVVGLKSSLVYFAFANELSEFLCAVKEMIDECLQGKKRIIWY